MPQRMDESWIEAQGRGERFQDEYWPKRERNIEGRYSRQTLGVLPSLSRLNSVCSMSSWPHLASNSRPSASPLAAAGLLRRVRVPPSGDRPRDVVVCDILTVSVTSADRHLACPYSAACWSLGRSRLQRACQNVAEAGGFQCCALAGWTSRVFLPIDHMRPSPRSDPQMA